MARNLTMDGREGYYPMRCLTLCTLLPNSGGGINEISQLKQDAAIPYLCDGATGHTTPNSPTPIPWGGRSHKFDPLGGMRGACKGIRFTGGLPFPLK